MKYIFVAISMLSFFAGLMSYSSSLVASRIAAARGLTPLEDEALEVVLRLLIHVQERHV